MKLFLLLTILICSQSFAAIISYEEYEKVSMRNLNDNLIAISIELNYDFKNSINSNCEDWMADVRIRYSELSEFSMNCKIVTDYNSWEQYYNDRPFEMTKEVGLYGQAYFIKSISK